MNKNATSSGEQTLHYQASRSAARPLWQTHQVLFITVWKVDSQKPGQYIYLPYVFRKRPRTTNTLTRSLWYERKLMYTKSSLVPDWSSFSTPSNFTYSDRTLILGCPILL